ncbi:MAG: hypothetical protein HGA39_05240 [Coriobacteriia bacterium]|nr:hypothetical protein [Coriobacteriia bacterium]
MDDLLLWISTYGAYIQFFVQIIFWILIAAAAFWAVAVFNRYVKFMTGADQVAVEEAPAPTTVSVDQFVD